MTLNAVLMPPLRRARRLAVWLDGKQIYLGGWDSEEQAAL